MVLHFKMVPFNIDATTPTLNFQTSGATRSSILFNDTDDKLVLTNNSNEMIKIYSDKINLLNNKALRFESTDSSYSNILQTNNDDFVIENTAADKSIIIKSKNITLSENSTDTIT